MDLEKQPVEGASTVSDQSFSNPALEAKSAVFHLDEISWNWQPGGGLVAKGKLHVTREPNSAPATVSFEIPIAEPPARSIFENPQEWVVSLVRRTVRA
jgi:hypothetical protein